mmetsp:Transcript_15634/g.28049  ORF Transcript_15634/g.28049 Transcript_15634/m.28049 type:complete len:208 (-) Transcript_15634:302-925(-)
MMCVGTTTSTIIRHTTHHRRSRRYSTLLLLSSTNLLEDAAYDADIDVTPAAAEVKSIVSSTKLLICTGSFQLCRKCPSLPASINWPLVFESRNKRSESEYGAIQSPWPCTIDTATPLGISGSCSCISCDVLRPMLISRRRKRCILSTAGQRRTVGPPHAPMRISSTVTAAPNDEATIAWGLKCVIWLCMSSTQLANLWRQNTVDTLK